MKRRLAITLLLALLTVAAAVAVRYRSCFFATSEVFRRYEHAQGIEADYIRNYPVNDTISLDMTLLVAEDSLTFANLLKDWNKSDEYITDMMSKKKEDFRLVGLRLKDHPELPADSDNNKNDVIAFLPQKRTVAIFHITHPSQINVLLLGNLHKRIKISNS